MTTSSELSRWLLILCSVTPTPLARGEAVTHGTGNCFLYDRMAQRPAVLVNLIFVFLGVLYVESGLKPSKRGLWLLPCTRLNQGARTVQESRSPPSIFNTVPFTNSFVTMNAMAFPSS